MTRHDPGEGIMGDPKRNTGPHGWRGGSGPAPAKADPNYKWKQGDPGAPGGGRRKVFAALLLVGMALCGVGAWVLIEWLKPPPVPGIVVVVADPEADAERVDVPLDLYGWQAGQQFLGQAGQDALKGSEVRKADLPDPAEPDALKNWVTGFARYDPLVVYFGLHCSTTADGPVVIGPGKRRVPVKDLIAAFRDHLSKNRKVLVFDPGRLPPDAAYGHLRDDFAAELKKLDKDVQGCPNLVVLCGADDGERGGESEELQTTAFAHYVLLGLRGYAAGDTARFNAEQVFEFAAQRTTAWAGRNRPGTQKPFRLPEGDDGRARAQGIEIADRPPGQSKDLPSDQVRTIPAEQWKELADHWAKHDALRDTRPGPFAHTPRAWRRYRELLLRYEAAVRAGAKGTAGRLNQSLLKVELDQDGRLASTPVQPNLPNLAAVKESQRNSTALVAALRDGTVPGTEFNPPPKVAPDEDKVDERAAYAEYFLNRPPTDGWLGRIAPQLKLLDPVKGGRPAEAHLPVMIEYFYTEVLKQGSAERGPEWARAVRLRRQAERAALGLRSPPQDGDIPAGAALTPERLWPIYAADVATADGHRREAEDRLFGSKEEDRGAAEGAMKKAEDGYARATDAATLVRRALDVRDRVTADLPFLTRWVAATAESDAEKRVTDLVDLWEKVHKLSATLDGLAGKPDEAAAAGEAAKLVWAEFERFDKEYRAVAERPMRGKLQEPWREMQDALVTPLIPAKVRMNRLNESREASAELLSGGQEQSGGGQKAEPSAAVARAKLAAAAVGREVIAAQHEKDKALPGTEPVNTFLEKRDVGAVAAALEAHLTRLGREFPDPVGAPNDQLERFSRLGPAAAKFEPWEPAAANHRLRWRDLFAALALRTAQDHWYDEKYTETAGGGPGALRTGQYFYTAAERYRAAAQAVARDLPPSVPAVDWAGLDRLLSVRPIQPRTADPFVWTSDRKHTFEFKLPVPKVYPIAGWATVLRRVKDAEFLQPQPDTPLAEREVVPIKQEAEFGTRLVLEAPKDLSVTVSATAKMVAFFRGQTPFEERKVEVFHRPELVLVDPLPAANERKVAVAVQADKDFIPGTVAVLIDYSGSMQKDLGGPGVEPKVLTDFRTNPNSRFSMALEALQDVLRELPKDTPLLIRVFSQSEMEDPLVFNGTVKWAKGEDEVPLRNLMDRLKRLTPVYATPLVAQILKTAEDLRGGVEPKTLVVLTDGAEQYGPDEYPTNTEARVKARELSAAFNDKYTTTALHVVQFALSQRETDLSKILFDGVEQYPTAGAVWPAENKEKLKENLLAAMRPKLKLRRGDLPAPGFPPTGLPSQITPNENALEWSKPFGLDDRDFYTAVPYPARGRPRYELAAEDGDRIILRFLRDPKVEGGVLVQRRLYADFIEPDPAAGSRRVQRTKDEEWVLTVQANGVTSGVPRTYSALTYLEKVPPHQLGDPYATPTLRLQRPEMIWWDVAPDLPDDKPKDPPDKAKDLGTVTVTRRYAFRAPAWQVEAANWPLGLDKPFAPARIQAYVIEQFATDGKPPTKVVLGGEDTVEVGGDEVKVRFAVEKHAVGKGPVQDCLVVRVDHKKDRPVYAQLPDRKKEAEHRYYKAANGYTAIFAGVDAAEAKDLTVKLRAVAPARDDKRMLTIRPPDPKGAMSIDDGIRILDGGAKTR